MVVVSLVLALFSPLIYIKGFFAILNFLFSGEGEFLCFRGLEGRKKSFEFDRIEWRFDESKMKKKWLKKITI